MTSTNAGDTRPFRQRLDDTLRRRDPAALREFLVAEGQWPEDSSNDEFAMWMMIAGSPALPELHAEADHWLMTHGHEADARLIAGNRTKPGRGRAPGASHGHRGGPGKRPRPR
jgi:hypothetical protein